MLSLTITSFSSYADLTEQALSPGIKSSRGRQRPVNREMKVSIILLLTAAHTPNTAQSNVREQKTLTFGLTGFYQKLKGPILEQAAEGIYLTKNYHSLLVEPMIEGIKHELDKVERKQEKTTEKLNMKEKDDAKNTTKTEAIAITALVIGALGNIGFLWLYVKRRNEKE